MSTTWNFRNVWNSIEENYAYIMEPDNPNKLYCVRVSEDDITPEDKKLLEEKFLDKYGKPILIETYKSA